VIRLVLITLSALAAVNFEVSAQTFQSALAAEAKGDNEEALRQWQHLADDGNGPAQMIIADYYYKGKRLPQNYHEAARWYSLAAEQGFPYAQTRLGLLYSEGHGVEQSDSKASEWFTIGAKQGYGPALTALGVHYWPREDGGRDPIAAHMWLNISAAEGSSKARELRDKLGALMTSAQVTSAQDKAHRCVTSEFRDCN
jgi:TPR repeat protein